LRSRRLVSIEWISAEKSEDFNDTKEAGSVRITGTNEDFAMARIVRFDAPVGPLRITEEMAGEPRPREVRIRVQDRRMLLKTVGALGVGGLFSGAAAADSDPMTGLAPPGIQDLRREASARWASLGFDARIVRVDSGDLHVAVGGQGAPLLLLHGYPQSGEIWRKIAGDLAGSHRVIIPDLPSMGLSGPAPIPQSLLAVAGVIDALLDALRIDEQVAVVGHDWGGAVGTTLALARRERISRLVFIESALAGAGFEAVWRFDAPHPKLAFIPFLLMEGTAEALVAGREDVFLHALWNTFTGDTSAAPFEHWAPFVAAIRQPGAFTASAGYYRSVYQSAEDTRRFLEAGKLTIPVLPIAGGLSFGDAVAAMAGNFAGDVRPALVLPGVGHFVPEERPAALRDALRTFLS
jgi:pimeloyl-ACP methyl ester carboxylesterase